MATATNRQWLPTTQFGMKGLVTQDDPQFIDDHALAQCMNVILDESQMAPRKGTDLLYSAPAADVGHPEQMFKFNDNQGNEYLLSKFTNHWYVLDPRSGTWVMIGSQIPGDAVYTGVTWHNIYYSNDAYAHSQNIAFFAPSDYAEPDNDTDPVLFWDMGMTYLSVAANIGDTFLTVEDTSTLTLAPNGQSVSFNLGSEKISASTGTTYVTTGIVSTISSIVSGITDTSPIEQGVSVSGATIQSGTTVLSIDSPTQITLSKVPMVTNQVVFNGTADTHTTNTVTNLNISSSGAFTSGVYNGQSVNYGVQVFGSNVQLAPGITYAITGTGVSANTTATLSLVVQNQYYVIASLTPNFPMSTTTGQTVTITNILNTGTIVTGSGIPGGTIITSLVGTIPLYTGFVMNNSATSSIVSNPIAFIYSPPVTLTFLDTKHLILTTGTSIMASHAIGTPVAALIQSTRNITGGTVPFPQGNVVLMWLNSVVIAGATGAIMFSKPLDPFFSAGFYFTVATISGRINDMRAFGQFFIAGTKNDLEIGQKIASADLTAVGALFTPYLSGQGMGPISPQGTLLYNNTYYYPTSTNGIIALTPNFTGTSSAAGVEILTDTIHNFLRNATFLRAMAFDRKLYWLFSFPATPEFPSQTYFLVYDMIRKAFTLSDFQAVDVAYYNNKFCIMGPDGDVYAGEQDSYEDHSEGGSGNYLVEAWSKRYDMGEPSLPKDTQHVMVQGKILSGTNLFVDVLYNEGGALGKTTYQIAGDPSSSYFTLPTWSALGSSPFGSQTFGSGNLAVGNYRVYLELNKSYKWHNYQLRFYTEKAGSYWTVGIVSPNVELSTIPTELVIGPQS